MMDFKIKIDLTNPQLFEDMTPAKPISEKKKKKKEPIEATPVGTEAKPKKKFKRSNNNNNNNNIEKADGEKEKKNESGRKRPSKKVERKDKLGDSAIKLNQNSLISLTLPNIDSLKGDQAQKLSMIVKKKPRHWEKRWVLVPNVFEFTKEIWLKKWVLVDGGDDIIDNDVSYIITI
jgi:hypothetical protein